jgi:hypothetical protein
MEDDLNFSNMEDDINFTKMEDNLNFSQIKDNLNFFKIKDNLNFSLSILQLSVLQKRLEFDMEENLLVNLS